MSSAERIGATKLSISWSSPAPSTAGPTGTLSSISAKQSATHPSGTSAGGSPSRAWLVCRDRALRAEHPRGIREQQWTVALTRFGLQSSQAADLLNELVSRCLDELKKLTLLLRYSV